MMQVNLHGVVMEVGDDDLIVLVHCSKVWTFRGRTEEERQELSLLTC